MDKNQSRIIEDNDYSEMYARKLKRYRPIAMVFLILIGLSLLFPVAVYILGLEKELFQYFLYFFTFPFVLAWLPVWQMRKCPACGRYMGGTIHEKCPKCGVRLQKSETSTLKIEEKKEEK